MRFNRTTSMLSILGLIAVASTLGGCGSQQPTQTIVQAPPQVAVAPAPASSQQPCVQYAKGTPQHSECLEIELAQLEARMNTMAPGGVPTVQYRNDDSFWRSMMTYMVLRDMMIGSYGYRLGYGWVPAATVVIPTRYYGFSYYGRSYTPTTFSVITNNQRIYATTVRSNPRASVVYGGRTVTTSRVPQVTSSNVSSYRPRYAGNTTSTSRPVTSTRIPTVGSTRTTTGTGITTPVTRTPVTTTTTTRTAPAPTYNSAPRSTYSGSTSRSGGFSSSRGGGFSS